MSGEAADPSTARPFLGGWHLVVPLIALAAFRDLWAPDEPRYAQIAREAWEGGSLLVLHICGDLYPDKPPLVYWLAGLAGKLGGWTDFAVRVPSILATIGSAWIAARIARRHFGETVASWTPTFYLGSAMVIWFGGRLQLDPLLAFFCLAAVDLIWNESGDARARSRRLLLAGLCAGLAALCKGPVAWLFVGFALVVLSAVPRAARASARWSVAAWSGFVVLAVAPVATWATAASLREPALWRPLFLGQHLGRATSADAPHAGPPWEHAWQMPLLFLPWTGLAFLGLASVRGAWRAARSRTDGTGALSTSDRGLVRATAWFALVFLVFSIMPPKRELYLLPLYPVAAWCAGLAFERALESGRLTRWVALPTTLLLLALGLGAGIAPRLVLVARPYAEAAMPIAVVLVVASGAAFGFLRRGNWARWADALALGLSATGLAAAIWVIPLVDPVKSARILAHEIAALPEKPAEIPCISVQPEGYRFYAGVPTVRGSFNDLAERPQGLPADFLALIAERDWDRQPDAFRARFRIVHRRQVGSRDVLVIGTPYGVRGVSKGVRRPRGDELRLCINPVRTHLTPYGVQLVARGMRLPGGRILSLSSRHSSH